MLSLGSLTPAPGWGQPRECRLTHDEQQTMMTLWSVFRSPLIFGGNLTKLDDLTTSLLTNPEILTVDQHSSQNHPVLIRPDLIVRTAKPEDGKGAYLAAFNPTDSALDLKLRWSELQMPEGQFKVRDLWARHDIAATQNSLKLSLAPHASTMIRITKIE